jgi:DNA mismatch repair ATPase MutS
MASNENNSIRNIYMFYQDNVEKFENRLTKTNQTHKLVSVSRAVLFLMILVEIYYYRSIAQIASIPILVLTVTGFLFSIKQSLRLNQEILKLKEFIQINRNELLALDGNIEMFHSGEEYTDKTHSFTYDLDIFGPTSLFQFLNRTCTIAGKNNLAQHLSKVIENTEEIKERQNAVLELKNKPEWRQNFIAEALSVGQFSEEIHLTRDITKEKLEFWSGNIFKLVHRKYIKIVLVLLPIFVTGSIIACIFGLFNYTVPVIFGIVNLSIIGIFLKSINREHAHLGNTVKSLKKIEVLIQTIEKEDFDCKYLNDLKDQLGINKISSHLIKTLYKTLQAFDWRLNMIAGVLLNGILLWDLQLLSRLEKLKSEATLLIPKWYEVLGEMDTLISLSNYAFNHTEFVFPELTDEIFTLEFKNGGHPLIHRDKRIENDFAIQGLHKIIIVTGANMAGKSTFLRTVNINMILGGCGAPVCASFFKFSPVALYTSIRTDDSLSKNESYFFAELMRLKKITDILKEGNTLFVTLDEMLKGTNSKDKHNGSYALIEQLIKYNASGIAATHDIELGKLAEVYPRNIENKRFEVEISGDDLHFDYLLKDGISQNLNASFLMKKYGITE